MAHLQDRILTPQSFSAENVLFPIYIKPYPGKPVVVMVEREEINGSILIPKEVADKYQPDFGVVAAFEPRRDSDGDIIYERDHHLKVGMLVAVKPYTGNWYTHRDFDWIPEGRILKILGTVEDWSENVLAAIEMEVAA